jgi:hypothetical protein
VNALALPWLHSLLCEADQLETRAIQLSGIATIAFRHIRRMNVTRITNVNLFFCDEALLQTPGVDCLEAHRTYRIVCPIIVAAMRKLHRRCAHRVHLFALQV